MVDRAAAKALRRARRLSPSDPGPGSQLLRALVPAGYGVTLLAGWFAPQRSLQPASVALLAGFIGYFLWRIHALLRVERDAEWERVELGLLATLAFATAVAILEVGAQWALVAYGVLITGLAAAVPFPGILALPLAAVTPWSDLSTWGVRILQLAPLALAAGLLTAVERRRRKRIQLYLDKLHLDSDHLDAHAGDDQTLAKGDLSRLDNVLYDYLQEVKHNTEAHGAVLAVRTGKGDLLYVREMVSDSSNIREESVLNLGGTTFHWILRNRKPLRIGRLRDPSARLGYYGGKVAVKSFLGVPLAENQEVEGVLAVDSLREDAFTDTHERVLKVAAHQVATILTQIQALERVKREARDFKHLHEFSKRLGGCEQQIDLIDLLLATLRDRVQPEFSAIALLNDEDRLCVEVVGEPRWADLQGRVCNPDDGLAGWVLSSRQYLHYESPREGARRPLFSHEMKVPEFGSLLFHPLEAHGTALGVLCIGALAERSFDPSAVAFCEVLAQQGAQTLLQIRTLNQLRALAATDSLTKLANRRVFLERLEAEVARSFRYEHGLSLLLLDVDHFKKINDQHGHPAGDEVLRRVAKELQQLARETDLVARYGGEEFAVLLPSTDTKGSRALADRMRKGVAALEIPWGKAKIPVRISGGFATLGPDGDSAEALVQRADQALYAAKERGRNQVLDHDEIKEFLSWG